jgi:hypothetical protein
MMVQRLAAATNKKSVAQKAEILLWMAEADFFDLLLDTGDDDFQEVLPAGTVQIRWKVCA